MRHKKHISTLKTRYIKTPIEIFEMGLSTLSISTYLLLCKYSEDFNPTLTNISIHLGVHRNSACRAMKELCIAGVIKKTRQGRVSRVTGSQVPGSDSYQSEYEFTNPDKWVKPKIVTQNVSVSTSSPDVSKKPV